jgi:hypothetical protein
VQNQTSQGNYNYNLQQQHEFAKQQLAQQLQETYIKEAQNAVQHRGGVSILRAMGGLQGVDPGIDADIEGGLTRAQDASTFDKAATGAYQAVQAGFPPNLTGLKNISGGILDTQGTPLSTTNLMIKEANENARHASGLAAAGDPSVSVQATTSPETGSLPATVNLKKGSLVNAVPGLRARGVIIPGPPGALPDTGIPPAGGAAASPSNKTPLPNAPASTTRAPAAAQPSGADMRQRVEAHVENNVRSSDPAAYKNIVAGKVGGNVNIVGTTPQGTPIVKGADGTLYR